MDRLAISQPLLLTGIAITTVLWLGWKHRVVLRPQVRDAGTGAQPDVDESLKNHDMTDASRPVDSTLIPRDSHSRLPLEVLYPGLGGPDVALDVE